MVVDPTAIVGEEEFLHRSPRGRGGSITPDRGSPRTRGGAGAPLTRPEPCPVPPPSSGSREPQGDLLGSPLPTGPIARRCSVPTAVGSGTGNQDDRSAVPLADVGIPTALHGAAVYTATGDQAP